MVFFDVGANDGYFTLFAARRMGPAARVIAVEPSSRERSICSATSSQPADQRDRRSAALGVAPGTVNLRLAQGTHSGHNTLGHFAHDGVQMASFEEVRVDALDVVATRLGLQRIDFIKIDVDGDEASVIVGAREVLRQMRPPLLLEINDKALQAQQRSAERLVGTLRHDFDYEILHFPT